jgi:GNAT superfamily N-acetyltransferase
MKLGQRLQVGASLTIASFDAMHGQYAEKVRLVKDLFTHPDARRKGDARYLMCEICVEADQDGTVLVLEPKATDDSPLSDDDLHNFYRRFGFVVVQREPVTFMARQPK